MSKPEPKSATLIELPQATIQLVRVAFLAVGVPYGLGLLIVNFDLGRHGLFSSNLVRSEYVMAGCLWLFLTLTMVAAVWDWYLKLTGESDKKSSFKELCQLVGKSIILLYLLSYILGILSRGSITVFSLNANTLWAFFSLFLNATSVLVVRKSLKWMLGQERPSDMFKVWLSPDAPFLSLSVSLVAILVSLSYYSMSIFPQIPREHGGGKKPVVDLLLTETPPDYLREFLKEARLPFLPKLGR